MKTMNASDFKAKCLSILDQVQQQGFRLIILKHGKPVAELRPVIESEDDIPQNALRGSVKIHGDVVSPVLSSADLSLEQDLV